MRRIFLALTLAAPIGAQSPEILHFHTDDDTAIERVREFDLSIERSDWRFCVNRAQELIDGAFAADQEKRPDSGSSVTTAATHKAFLYPDPSGEGVFFGIREYVNRRLSALPPEAIQLYRKIHGTRASGLLKGALLSGDPNRLLEVADRFRMTRAGARALLRLGHTSLEAGDAATAALHFEDLRTVTWNESSALPRRLVLTGLALAYGRLGETHLLENLRNACRSEETTARIAGMPRDIAEVARDWLNAPPEHGTRGPGFAGVEESGNGPTGALESAWEITWKPVGHKRALPLLRCQPVVEDGITYFHTRELARAVEIDSGRVLWSRRLEKNPEHPHLGPSLSTRQRFLKGAVGGGLYILVVRPSQDSPGTPACILVALDKKTGEIAWTRSAGPGDTPAAGGKPTLFWEDTPLIVGDRLFVTASDLRATPQSYVACLDLRTGRDTWISRIGSGTALPYHTSEGDLPDPSYWVTSLPLTFARGLVYMVDNLGSFAALEADTGRPRFVFQYQRRRIDGTNRLERHSLPRGWSMNPVFVDGERVAIAPDDSDRMILLFTRPPRDPERTRKNINFMEIDTYKRRSLSSLVGYRDGIVYLAGRDADSTETILEAVALQEPRHPDVYHRWMCSAPLDTPLNGRGTIAGNGVYVCSQKYVYRVDPVSGTVHDPLVSREADGSNRLGHVAVVKGSLLIGGHGSIQCYRTRER